MEFQSQMPGHANEQGCVFFPRARGELVNRVLYDCQQFHDGFGYMRESAIERMVRDARIHSIGGATEFMLGQVAKRK